MTVDEIIAYLKDEISWWGSDTGCDIKYEAGRKDSLANVLNYIKDNS